MGWDELRWRTKYFQKLPLKLTIEKANEKWDLCEAK
jgi:hypothetical protein